MDALFADTFLWIALTNPQDGLHSRSKEFVASSAVCILHTTEKVLTEYLNYFAGWGPNFRRKAVLNVQTMREDNNVRITPQTPASFEKGYRLYASRFDKGYSLTDCISMEAMRNLGIERVLTNDLHFEQEGFRALLRSR